MLTPHLATTMQNILFLQMLALLLVPGHVFQTQQELLRIWKKFNTGALKNRPARKERFWEIDMTKFEP